MWTIFQMLIEWTVVRYVQSFDKKYSQIRKHHIRNLKFQLKQIKFKRYHIYYRPCLDTRLSQSPVTNACFGGGFPASQPPVSALHKRGQWRRAWKRQQKQRRRNERLCRLCGPGNTVTRTSLVLCVRVCVFCFTDIAFSEGGSAVDQTHTKCASDCAWKYRGYMVLTD